LISTPLSPFTIEAVAAAREFWSLWFRGCHHYRAAVEADLLVRQKGVNWACFDHQGLMELLPDLKLPHSALRAFYLIRLEGYVRPFDIRLIICSRLGSPVAIHPLF
jgi:hypothetical protein